MSATNYELDRARFIAEANGVDGKPRAPLDTDAGRDQFLADLDECGNAAELWVWDDDASDLEKLIVRATMDRWRQQLDQCRGLPWLVKLAQHVLMVPAGAMDKHDQAQQTLVMLKREASRALVRMER